MGEFRGNQHTDNEYDDYRYENLVGDVAALAKSIGHPPTTEDAMQSEQLPCLARIYSLTDNWNAVLDDAGLERSVAGRYDEDERPAMLADLRKAAGVVDTEFLSSRQYTKHGDYPTSVVKEYFGSWSDACDAAGLQCSSKHGKRCEGPQGAILESLLELRIATILDENEVEYSVHPAIDDTDWTGDFYLPNGEVWIEADGYVGERPNEATFRAKLDYYDSRGFDYFVVRGPDDLRRRLSAREIL